MNKIHKLVKKELSGHNAWQHANYCTQFMRTPGSLGLKETLNYSRKRLNEYKIDKVYTIKYPSKENGTELKLLRKRTKRIQSLSI